VSERSRTFKGPLILSGGYDAARGKRSSLAAGKCDLIASHKSRGIGRREASASGVQSRKYAIHPVR
jgi:hypothetical protein